MGYIFHNEIPKNPQIRIMRCLGCGSNPKSSQNINYLNKGFEILNLIHCQSHLISCFQMMDDYEKSLIHFLALKIPYHALQNTQMLIFGHIERCQANEIGCDQLSMF